MGDPAAIRLSGFFIRRPGCRSDLRRQWGYIDRTGAWAIERQFASASDFSEGLAMVQMGIDNQTTGYIDKTGAWVIGPQYAYGWPFVDGLAWVDFTSMAAGTSAHGHIDKTGRRVAWQRAGG